MPVVRDDVRKLATVETVRELAPIEGADKLERATIRGWTVVVKKGEFSVGDRVIYFEEDTALPVDDPRFAFLAPRGVKTDEEGDFHVMSASRERKAYTKREYHVLKIARLRGVYSQGLILPFSLFYEDLLPFFPGMEDGYLPVAGVDVTLPLGLGKWEPPLVAGNGDAKGSFYSGYVQKTDAERVQNLDDNAWAVVQAHKWVATEKVDGTSLTVIRDRQGELHVNSRNQELREGDNMYWNVTKRFALGDLLEPGEALQAEIAGEGVQGNRQGIKGGLRPFIFNFARDHKPVPRAKWPEGALALSVPELSLPLPATREEALAQVDGMKSTLDPKRLAEGVVWHEATGEEFPELGNRSVWKAISNKYLTKG